MAITAPTKRSDFAGFLTPEMSAPIFEEAARRSVVQQLSPQVPLGTEGKAIPVVTGKLSAGWVAEGGQKPASKGALGLKTIKPEKLAAIAVVSAEVVRANPGGYMTQLREQVGEAFAVAFDNAALHNVGGDGTGTGPFATWIDQTTKSVTLGTGTTIHNDFVAALAALVNDGKRLTGFALDDTVEPLILDEVDGNNRPLYVNLATDDTSEAVARPGRLLGRSSFMGEGVAHPDAGPVAYAGNWRQTAWGVASGISYDVSTEATVTINGELTSLWEHNLVAIRAEAEYGWLVNDVASFVKFAPPASGGG